jgi:Domain of unknown function (DUF4352)
VIVEMELTNRRDETRTIVADAMRLKTRSGRLYSPDDEASLSADKALILDDVQPDVPKQGTLVYDVPAAQISGAKLRVEDLFSDAHGFINLELSGAEAGEQSATPPSRTDPGEQGVTPSSSTGEASDAAAAEEAVQAHWNAIERGDYRDAYGYLSADQQRTFSEAGWVQDHQRDAPTSADVEVAAADVGTSTGTVEVLTLRTEAAATGCKDWSGSYQMVKETGAWKIDKAKLTPSSC